MRSRAALVAAGLLVGLPASASAQSLRYTSVNEMELGGALGTMMSMMPGTGGTTESTTYIQNSKIRTDSDKTSSIVDWNTGKMIFLDHASRTYTSFDFATMTQQMTEAMGKAPPSGGPPAAAQPADQPKIEWEVHFATDRTGEKEKIDGYDAERVILTTEVTAKSVPEGDETQEQLGMAIVSELWLSKDFPEYEMMQNLQGEAADRIREQAAQGTAASMQAFSAMQPGLSDAWQKNMEELGKLEGYAVRSTMLFVTLPPDGKLDRDAALAEKDAKLSSGAGSAAASSAADAAKKALGGLAGRFGRGKKEEPKAEEVTMTQAVFMRMKSEIRDVDTAAIDPSIFEIPAGYTERPMGGPIGG